MHYPKIPVRHYIHRLRWILPIALIIIVLLYQLGLSGWVNVHFGDTLRLGIEILLYVLGAFVLFLGLTWLGKRLDSEQELERQAQTIAQRMSVIAAESADAIMSLDGDGAIATWNLGAEDLLGYSEEDVLGEPFNFLLGTGKAQQVEFQWLVDTVAKAGYIRGYETNCWDASGKPLTVELTATLLHARGGEKTGMSIILRDITNTKLREQEMRQRYSTLNQQVAERTRELAAKVDELGQANIELQKLDQTRSEFVSLVSHQLRAPLTNITGAVERIRSASNLNDQNTLRMLDIIEQQITRLDHLVNDVLNIVRLESGQMIFHPEPLSLSPLIKQVVEQIRARIVRRTIKLLDKPGLPMAFADRDLITEVLTNLIDNADKYTPQGGEISLEVRADQTEITVAVRDTGPGLPPHSLERVFKKFYRADSSDSQSAYGYGLGLYVCQLLVEAQSGRIWAENHPDGGAVISFTLPVWQDQERVQ